MRWSTTMAAGGVATVLSTALLAPAISGEGPIVQSGWTLPEDAEQKKNPLPVDDTLLETGRALYKDKCQRCHGPGGLGDGPDADPDAADMDITNPKRAARNPDGVVFYKIWHGRKSPKMPALSAELDEQQVWALVAYAQSLRKKPPRQ